jgi:hypothetical protein
MLKFKQDFFNVRQKGLFNYNVLQKVKDTLSLSKQEYLTAK